MDEEVIDHVIAEINTSDKQDEPVTSVVGDKGGGHRTFQVSMSISGQIFKLGWGHRTKFKDV